VNSAGLVELVPYNLLSYSERFENAYWNKNGGSISANSSTAPNGTTTADRLTLAATTATHGLIDFGVSGIATSTYTVSFFVKKGTHRYITIGIYRNTLNNAGAGFDLDTNTITGTGATGAGYSASGATITDAGNGWYRCSVVCVSGTTPMTGSGLFLRNTSYTSGAIQESWAAAGTETINLWGAQLVEGTNALDYFATETRLNIPRLDYSLGSCPSILVEPQRTNLLTWSEAFDNVAWTKVNATITANSITSPNGTITADTFTDNSTSGSHVLARFTTIIVGSQTASIYVKPNTLTKCYIGNSSTGNAVCFDLSTQTIEGYVNGTGNAWTNPIIEALADGWFRVSASLVATASGTLSIGFYKVFNATSFGAMSIYVGSGETAYIWGAQAEAGAYPTSYIPTTSASVTRNNDVTQRTNVYTNGLITSSGGTWFIDFKNNRVLTRDASYSTPYLMDSASKTNGFYFNSDNSRLRILKMPGFVTLYTTTTDNAKIAIKWDGTTADIFENGVKVVSSTAFTFTAMELLDVSGFGVPKYINAMALWKTALNDDQLELLTGDSFYTYAEMASYYNYTLQ
jgi:hypothetical protein